MFIHYYKGEDYKKAVEGAKRIVAVNYAKADATLKSSKVAGELISDEVYEEFLVWQLLMILLRNQEVSHGPDDMDDDEELYLETDDEEEDDDE